MIYKNKHDLITSNIKSSDVVLDVGFYGQGVSANDSNWPHKIIKDITPNVYGIDILFDENQFKEPMYKVMSAENFNFPVKFDVIFAGDLIEHLSNFGLFLECCKKNLKVGGKVIITTPNAFNLFNISEKLTKYEPTVNPEHTCYFNTKTIKQLSSRYGFKIESRDYVYSLGVKYKESLKKKVLNIIYFVLSKFTDKFIETMAIILK